MTERTDGIFSGLTAWFSSSVRTKRRYLWEKEGGEITPVESAQFLFSENAQALDTVSIYESKEYEKDHLSVFHSMYIKKCIELGNAKEVKLGDYFLPPLEIQKLVRKHMSYKWELDMSDGELDKNSELEEQVEEGQPCSQNQLSTSSPAVSYDVKKLPRYEGPLTVFSPGKNGNEVFCVR